ncbi:MAG: hypothetical protein M3439_04650 [Chloroflexota bacterium]|nr:hypothetical protein [Chloroflexota bacterium]
MSFQARVRIGTPVEWEDERHGGILAMVLWRLVGGATWAKAGLIELLAAG